MGRLSKSAEAILAAAPPLPLNARQWQHVVETIGLSEQEARVVELVLRDLCNKQIAVILGISPKTVEEYLQYRIPKKTHTRGRMQLSMHVLTVVLKANAG